MEENNLRVYYRKPSLNVLTKRHVLKHKQSWKEAWTDKHFRIQLLILIFYFIGLAIFFPWFFDFIEARDGKMLNDFILDFLPAQNASKIIFLCLYSGMTLSLFYLTKHPRLFLLSLTTYCMVTTLRIICITLFPLHAPLEYIPLDEPVAQIFSHNGKIISKDLFFSGHVATVLSLYYPVKNKIIRRILFCLSAIVGLLVLVQHAHYTIDVVMAVFATYGCYLLAQRITSKIKGREI